MKRGWSFLMPPGSSISPNNGGIIDFLADSIDNKKVQHT